MLLTPRTYIGPETDYNMRYILADPKDGHLLTQGGVQGAALVQFDNLWALVHWCQGLGHSLITDQLLLYGPLKW